MRFADAELEAAFWHAFYKDRRRQLQINILLALVVVVGFAWIDPLVAPELADRLLWVRCAGAAPPMVIGLWLLSAPRMQGWMHRRIAEATMLLVLAVFVPLIYINWLLLEGADYPLLLIGLMGVSIAFFVVVGMTRLRFKYLTLLVLGCAPIAILIPLHRTTVPPDSILPLLGFFFTYMAIVLAVGYALELADRKVFLQQRALDTALDRADGLLANILPLRIIADLQAGREPIADRHPEVSVLFADLVNFTPLAERLDPADLVRLLHGLFTEFDDLTRALGLEKVKTIGDAYMVVAGLPHPRADHADVLSTLALQLLQVPARQGHPELELRIGIHSGPVVAGVIGRHKFAFDVWGDTVNMAARLESHGEPGRIQISEATKERLTTEFALSFRGHVHLKGKAEVPTWWLDGARIRSATEVQPG